MVGGSSCSRPAAVALLLLAACAPEVADVGEGALHRAAMVGGTPTVGDPATVALAIPRARCGDPMVAFCSGVVVAPRVVLTAAHCVTDERGPLSAEVFFGSDVAATGDHADVVSVAVHPGYDPDSGAFDAALVVIDPPTAIAPVALPTTDLAALPAGSPLRAVGFGVTARDADDPGVKREGGLVLGAVAADRFEAHPGPAMTCVGDSGGPVFAEVDGAEQLVGLTVDGDLGCEDLAIQVRVDALLDGFLTPFLASVDDIPTPADGPVALDAICATGCVADGDCPAGLRCQPGLDGEGRCTTVGLPAGDYGDVCADDASCESGVCGRIAAADGACRCFDACSAAPIVPDGDSGRAKADPRACGCAHPRLDGVAWGALVGLTLVRRRRRSG